MNLDKQALLEWLKYQPLADTRDTVIYQQFCEQFKQTITKTMFTRALTANGYTRISAWLNGRPVKVYRYIGVQSRKQTTRTCATCKGRGFIEVMAYSSIKRATNA